MTDTDPILQAYLNHLVAKADHDRALEAYHEVIGPERALPVAMKRVALDICEEQMASTKRHYEGLIRAKVSEILHK